ncbi:NHLP-related RiPP peptide [Dokdonella fugitiva]|jgi:putative modified peptide|uniref:Putative modified peptide n=1 Tax=Dokdonella fugitiva TaxID=328517 RepID=A0A4R2IGP1_9GAMM|nr:NHLP-related RiPP peptide [Dokdonella fugitiva]MBA8882637.1 putative modified peptide [Dokdonella fugitiva]TCO43386.1 putative modified peptide [Dokdonella fugitiva]
MGKGIASSEQLDQLLDRLGTDDQFREKFLGDPAAALAEHGVQVDPGSVPAVRNLPSKEALQSQRAEIRAKVDGAVGMGWFLLSK